MANEGPSSIQKHFSPTWAREEPIANYDTNQVVFSQGDPAKSVFFIEQGKVKLTVISEQGKEAVAALLGKGEFLGEGCLAGQLRRTAAATTMSDCQIMQLEKGAIVRVLHDEPAFSELFISHLLDLFDWFAWVS